VNEETDLVIARRRSRIYLAVLAALLITSALSFQLQWRGNAELHTLMEVAATLVAFMVGIVALVHFYAEKSNIFLFLGTGFVGTGFLDGYHAIVTSDWFGEFGHSSASQLIPWSWSASRTFLSVLMLMSWWTCKPIEPEEPEAVTSERWVYGITGLLTLASFLFFETAPLPPAYFPDFLIGRPAELLPALLFLAALIGYLDKGQWKTQAIEHWIVLALIVNLVCQIAIMPFSFRLFDTMFDLAHILKLVGYLCVLTGLLHSMFGRFREAKTSAQNIAALNRELESKVENRTREAEEKGTAALEKAKEAEQARRQLAIELKNRDRFEAELQRSNRDLDEFAYVASHDLKAPLRSIRSIAEWVAEDEAERLSEEGKENLALLQGRVERMQRLLEDLLQYARAGRTQEKIATVDTGELVSEIVELLDPPAGFQVEAMEKMPILKTFRAPLQKVLLNLVSNAVKHHDREEGRIGVSARPLEDFWEFVVQDDGPGIPPQSQEKVFKMFQTLKSRDDVEGSGIGLAVVKRTVESLGGTICLQSGDGRGSAFKFTWPATVSVKSV
jgi:signal transduction histidine kinase